MLEKNLKPLTKEYLFDIQSLISLNSYQKISDDYNAFYEFNQDFLNQNISEIMDLKFGKDILDVSDEIRALNRALNSDIINSYSKTQLIYKIRGFLDNVECKNTNYERTLDLIYDISRIIDLYGMKFNEDLKEILKMQLEKIENNKKIYSEETISILENILSLEFDAQIEKSSTYLNEYFFKLLNNYDKKLLLKFGVKYKEFSDEISNYLLIAKSINGHVFELSNKMAELQRELFKNNQFDNI